MCDSVETGFLSQLPFLRIGLRSPRCDIPHRWTKAVKGRYVRTIWIRCSCRN